MAKISRTWWGNRFIQALEEFMDPHRLRRGKAYRNDNRILSWKAKKNVVSATIKGNINEYYGVFEEPRYKVEIKFNRISKEKWSEIINNIALNASGLSRLMLGEIPPKIEEVFALSDEHFLPNTYHDLDTQCSCPDWDNPCKHIAGLYFRLAEQLDSDPILLFELRGLTKEKLQELLLQTELGAALSEWISEAQSENFEPDQHFFTQPNLEALPSACHFHKFWGVEFNPPKINAKSSAAIPAVVIKKQGDYPPFWPKDASFILTMEKIYAEIKKKNKL